MTSDLGYVVSHKDLANYMLFHENNSLFTSWLRFLFGIQGMDYKYNLRVLVGHAEYDQYSWIQAFGVELEILNFLELLIAVIFHLYNILGHKLSRKRRSCKSFGISKIRTQHFHDKRTTKRPNQ